MHNLVFTFEDGSQALAHHGIKGMKWGVRRYQNADGSLTSAGRQRYGEGSGVQTRKGMSDGTKRKLKTAAKIAGGAALAGLAGYAAYKGGTNYLRNANNAINLQRELGRMDFYNAAKAPRNIGRRSTLDSTVSSFISNKYNARGQEHVRKALKIASSPKYKAASAYTKAINRGKSKVNNLFTKAGARSIERQSARNYKKYVKNLPHNSFGTKKRVEYAWKQNHKRAQKTGKLMNVMQLENQVRRVGGKVKNHQIY